MRKKAVKTDIMKNLKYLNSTSSTPPRPMLRERGQGGEGYMCRGEGF